VQVGEHHRGILLEGVEHAVAVMRVDVDVADALQSRTLEQLDGHTAVVEHAEAGGAIARGVVQSRDGHEGAPALALHDRLHGAQGGAHHARGRFIHAAEGRRVAGIEKSATALRAVPHELEVGGAVEGKQFLVRGGARLEHAHAPVEAARLELAHESGVTVRPEWVAIAESVASQALAEDHSHAAHVGREAPLRGVSQALQA
jgi:hypothetical protein